MMRMTSFESGKRLAMARESNKATIVAGLASLSRLKRMNSDSGMAML
jgi:hypothetical protein